MKTKQEFKEFLTWLNIVDGPLEALIFEAEKDDMYIRAVAFINDKGDRVVSNIKAYNGPQAFILDAEEMRLLKDTVDKRIKCLIGDFDEIEVNLNAKDTNPMGTETSKGPKRFNTEQ